MYSDKKKDVAVLVILIVLLFVINYGFLDRSLQNFLGGSELVVVERIIDGDTLVANNSSIRLLGINSPEKGERYYEEARQFLEGLALNKTARLEFTREKQDRYKRTLAYVYINGKNINLELVEKGFANIYFPSGKDHYYNMFLDAWEKCTENLCEMSANICAACIKLKEIDVSGQKVVFQNTCNFNCVLTDWSIKDEGRKKFVFDSFILESNKEVKVIVGVGGDSKDRLFWQNEEYVWTSTGDSLFLRDAEEKLVLWKVV